MQSQRPKTQAQRSQPRPEPARTQPTHTQPARTQPARSQWPLMLLIAGCAAGAGVTGTLMLARQSSAPAYVPVTPDAAAGSPGASGISGAQHEPPASLTAGMSPAQGALALGNWYYDHEQWPQAASNYKNALAGGLDNANVRTDLGNSLRFSGEPKAALEQYQIAQGQDPQHEQSLFNQGGLWAFSLRDKARGVAAWKAYLKKFPQGQSAADARRLMKQVQSGSSKPEPDPKTKPKT